MDSSDKIAAWKKPSKISHPEERTTESNNTHEYMKTHIKICQYMGMWPVDHEKGRIHYIYHNALVLTVMSILLFVLFIPFTLKIITDFHMDGVATVIDFDTVVASGIFRYVYVYVRGERYKELIQSMYEKFVYQSFYPENKKMDMKKYSKIGMLLGATYFCSAYVWILQMCFGPLLAYYLASEEPNLEASGNTSQIVKKLPMVFEGYFPFDINYQPVHAIIYSLQAIGFLILGYIYLMIDAFWYMIIILTIGQLDLINYSFRNLKSIMEGENAINELQAEKKGAKEIEYGMKQCIKQHRLTREFIHQIENVLTPNVLVDFMHAVLSITFILLDMTIAINNQSWMRALHLFEYFTVSIVHMFLFDWLGNELVLREEELAAAVYDTPWYCCPSEIKDEVLTVTIQSRHPYRLTGGKMYNMSLEFFVGTIKMIFSYFMVLLQLRNEK